MSNKTLVDFVTWLTRQIILYPKGHYILYVPTHLVSTSTIQIDGRTFSIISTTISYIAGLCARDGEPTSLFDLPREFWPEAVE